MSGIQTGMELLPMLRRPPWSSSFCSWEIAYSRFQGMIPHPQAVLLNEPLSGWCGSSGFSFQTHRTGSVHFPALL